MAGFEKQKRYLPTQIQELQYVDKYSRFNYRKGRREAWDESVARAVAFLVELSENKLSNKDYTDIMNAMLNMEAFSSMRLFAMAGEAARRCNSVLYNCSYIAIDSVRAFSEILYLSMSGTGVGFSVEKGAVNHLPEIQPQPEIDIKSVWEIDDSQDGWAEAFHIGLTSWFSGSDCVFDYSKIRPIGSVLKTKGGRASGPEPLRKLLDYSRETILNAQGRKLRPIEVHDIVCMIGDCAVSGGSRRSAMISLFDRDDKEMLHAKDYGWWKAHPQRANANNSAVITHDLAYDEVEEIMYTMHNGGGGEPGFYMRKNAGKMAPRRTFYTDPGTNPCFAPDTLVKTKDGNFQIKDLIGKAVEVWNGEEWILVDNWRITNNDQPGVEIELNNGKKITVTSYHSMILANGKRKKAENVRVGDILKPTDPNNNLTKVVKTTYRFLAGDVYCCTEPTRHEISLACGVQVGQCGEIDLNSHQFCNLSQAIVRATDTPETLKEKVRVATIIGTIQSMATHFRYISDDWKQHTEKDRLLGVDLTGQLDHPELITPELLDELRKYAIEVNRQYADKLGITPSVAITCNKPSGNSSVLFSCAPGIHSQWSDYYIRRMRINANSPVRYALENSGFKLLPENGQEYSTATTLVAEFPMKAPDGAVTNGSRGAIEQCEWWKMNKIHWTEHNPSNTITYTADELDDLVWWVYDNQDIIGGMSFLEKDNHYYPLAPLEKINKETYERMVEELPDIDFNYLTELETEDYTTVASEVACIGGACLI